MEQSNSVLNDPRKDFCKWKKLDLSPSQGHVQILCLVCRRDEDIPLHWAHNKRRTLPWKNCDVGCVTNTEWEKKIEVAGTQQLWMLSWSHPVPGSLNDSSHIIHTLADNHRATALAGMSLSSPAPFLGGVGLQLAGQRSWTAVGFLLVQLLISGYLRACYRVTSEGMEVFGSAPKLASHPQLWKSWT